MSRKTVKHLKVPWSKLRQRVRVFLKNVFALRFFVWRRCFGDSIKMRWVSWDQKPAWFNNTALDATYSTIGYEPLVKEIEAHSRQRFTVCTCVDSAATSDPDEPPPVGILFKAAPRGRVWRELTASPLIPAWMHVQTQCKGSYRASGMVECLEQTLTPAGEDCESPAMPNLPGEAGKSWLRRWRRSFRVMLPHGGGTTGYEQITDTDFHATLKARMEVLERL